MAKLNKYGLRHQWFSGLEIGRLTPIFMQEVSPGEIFRGRSRAMLRMAPMNTPVYMQLSVQANIFYVPYRLLWDEFPEVWTGEDTSTAWPTITYNPVSTIWGMFGVGANITSTPAMNALPIRAFNTIWNEHYRNPLEQAERGLDTVLGELPLIHHSSHDYYGSIQTELAQAGSTSEQVTVTGGLWDVVDYRDAMNRQRYKERRAAYGERYEDVLLNEHGMNINNVRLDKPEHCARGKTIIGVSEVVATATSAGETTGEYKGHGIAGMQIKFPARKFPEPGILMGVAYARPRLQLNHREDKIWQTQTNDDLYHPHLTTDTQQIVNSREIYNDTAGANFGYIGKYDHLRKARDTITSQTQMSTFTCHKELSAVPTVAYLHQVQDHDHIFQDANDIQVRSFFDHNISKLSPIPRRRK